MTDEKSKVMELLKSWPSKKRQIEQLRYEIEHPALLGEKELIESLALGVNSPGEGVSNSGHISNKTMAIALQYQDIMQRINNETISGIIAELRSLEAEVSRLEYYVSLLDERKATAIRLLYFEQKSWNVTESELHVSKGTLSACRNDALSDLTKMYSYLSGVREKDENNG